MSRIMKRRLLPALALLLAVLLAACGGGVAGGGAGGDGSEAAGGSEGGGQAGGDYPSETLNWTIAFGPGGGNDILSRTMIDIIEKNDLYSQPIVAENREGGSGAVGWGFLFNQAGNPYHISTTSGSSITTPLEADTPWDPTSFTPVALLASDELILIVNGDSEITSLQQFIDSAKEEPPALGGIGSVNVDFIVLQLLASQAGFEFDYVPFNDEGELTAALLSGSLDGAVSNPAEVLGLMDSGDVRGLAYTGDEVPEALGDIPALGDEGFEIDIATPRGLVLPPDVDPAVTEFWQDVIRQVVETPEWATYIEENLLTEQIAYGEEFEQILTETTETYREILIEEGAIEG